MKRMRRGLFSRIQDAHIRRHEQMNEEHEVYYEEIIRKHMTSGLTLDRKMKLKLPRAPKSWVLTAIVAFYLLLLVDYVLADWLMSLVYDSWFPAYADTFGRHLVTALLMMVIIGTMVMLIRLLFDPGREQITMFIIWIAAMRRMAHGDFNVRLDFDPRHTGSMGVLVKHFNQMATALGQMETLRQEFISNVSHEFQSPLTSISGFARALQNDSLTPEMRKHYLEIIELESIRLSRLSDNLLKLTSLESKHHPFEPKPYRLDRQLRRIVLACEPLWQKKDIAIDIDLPSLTITADEELLDQVWINLLGNAIKFTPGGGTGTIAIKVEPEQGDYRISFADNGPGIAEEHHPHLFERFYKADKARTRSASGSGSGLGLSIVRKIVEMHDGSVTVRNRPGSGAVFTVRLPVDPLPITRGS